MEGPFSRGKADSKTRKLCMLDGKMSQERESAGRRRVALQFIRWFVIREGSGMVRVQEESVQR